MNHHFARIVLLLPLLWLLASITAWAGSRARFASVRPHSANNASNPDFFGKPIAKLGTPEKSVEVFMVSPSEHSQWTYVVVSSEDEDHSEQRYGDDQTVGQVLRSLSKDLHVATKDRDALRCPAASSWVFENPTGHVSYCSHSADATRIERAISLLELAPTAN